MQENRVNGELCLDISFNRGNDEPLRASISSSSSYSNSGGAGHLRRAQTKQRHNKPSPDNQRDGRSVGSGISIRFVEGGL